jgi:GINS complex subunit 3
MDDAYYSLDQLLAENQKIPCIFNIAVPGMGYLEGTNERDVSQISLQEFQLTHFSDTIVSGGSRSNPIRP